MVETRKRTSEEFMHDPIAWWAEHKNSPGMDRTSKRTLLDVLRSRKDKDFDRITAEFTSDEQRAEWDAVFAADYKLICDTIAEIEATL